MVAGILAGAFAKEFSPLFLCPLVLLPFVLFKKQLKIAKKLPKTNKLEREIREDEINRARVKKQALALVKKYGEENIKEPNILEKEEILNRETKNFKESMTQRKDLRAYLKKESIYLRATKPFREADNLIKQSENYTHYEELVEKYNSFAIEM